MGDALLKILVASMIIEALIETLKISFKKYDGNTLLWSIIKLILSFLVCFSYSLDLLEILGYVDHIPYLGVILTAILISRGSSFLHDFIKKISAVAPIEEINIKKNEETPKKEQIKDNVKNERTITK